MERQTVRGDCGEEGGERGGGDGAGGEDLEAVEELAEGEGDAEGGGGAVGQHGEQLVAAVPLERREVGAGVELRQVGAHERHQRGLGERRGGARGRQVVLRGEARRSQQRGSSGRRVRIGRGVGIGRRAIGRRLGG